MRKIQVISILLIIVILLTGCWNRRELNTLGIVSAVAIDKQDEQFNLTFEVIKPTQRKGGGGGEKEKNMVYVQSSGASTFEAIRNATLSFDRRLFFPHCREYIFSEETARRGLVDIIDFWNRDHETRRTPYMVIAKGSKASDIFGVKGGIEETTSTYLERIIENQPSNAKTVMTPIRDFLQAYYAEGSQPIAVGVVRKKKIEKIGKSEDEYVIEPEGAAVFSKSKLVGFLDGEQTMGLNFVINKVKGGILVAPTLGEESSSAVEILEVKTKNEIASGKQGLKIDIDVKLKGMLAEVNTDVDLKSPEVIEKIEREIERSVKNKVEDTIRIAQQVYHLDIFGFGKAFKGDHYHDWKQMESNWDRIFSTAHVNVSIKTEIVLRGLTNNPVLRKVIEK